MLPISVVRPSECCKLLGKVWFPSACGRRHPVCRHLLSPLSGRPAHHNASFSETAFALCAEGHRQSKRRVQCEASTLCMGPVLPRLGCRKAAAARSIIPVAFECLCNTSPGVQARRMHHSVGHLPRSPPFATQRSRTAVRARTRAVLAPADPKSPQPSRPSPAPARGLSAALLSVFRGSQRSAEPGNAALSSLEEATARRAEEVSILSNSGPGPPAPLAYLARLRSTSPLEAISTKCGCRGWCNVAALQRGLAAPACPPLRSV